MLSEAGFVVYGQYLIAFRPLNFSLPPVADWVFCYSSRAAAFFLRGLQQHGLTADRYPRYAALGAGTAKKLQELGIQPAFTGTGDPLASVGSFAERAAGKRVLFPRAEQSRQSIQRLLGDQIEALDLIVYRNSKLTAVELPDTRYVVLTSPLNAEAYLSIKGQGSGQRIVAIGSTTAEALASLQVESFRVADQASEAALAKTVLDWENE